MAAVVTGTERRVAAVVQTPQLLAQLSAIHDAAAPETSDGCTGDSRRANAGAAQGDSCAHRPRMYRYSCTRRWLPTSRTRGSCRRNRRQSIGRWAQQGTTRSCTAAARSRWPSDELASTRSRAVHAPSDRDRESVRGGRVTSVVTGLPIDEHIDSRTGKPLEPCRGQRIECAKHAHSQRAPH